MTLCIINYNGVDHLRSAFEAIRQLPDGFDEILVIDNASTDDSVTYACSIEGVKVLQLARNDGPGAARNAGFKRARNDLILFQDNDIRLLPDTVNKLLEAINREKGPLIVAPRVVYRQKPEIIQYDSADCHVLGMMTTRNTNQPASTVSQESVSTTSLVTACFLMQRQRWDDSPLFDEQMIFNMEDHDLGVRANVLGHTLMVVPAATVLHGSGTAGLSWRPGYAIASQRIFCLIRNRWWILLRYFSLRTLVLLAPLLAAFEILQLAGMLSKGFWREWLEALYSTVQHLPRLLQQRRRLQANRQKADSLILKLAPLPLTSATLEKTSARRMVKLFEGFMFAYWRLVSPCLQRSS